MKSKFPTLDRLDLALASFLFNLYNLFTEKALFLTTPIKEHFSDASAHLHSTYLFLSELFIKFNMKVGKVQVLSKIFLLIIQFSLFSPSSIVINEVHSIVKNH